MISGCRVATLLTDQPLNSKIISLSSKYFVLIQLVYGLLVNNCMNPDYV